MTQVKTTPWWRSWHILALLLLLVLLLVIGLSSPSNNDAPKLTLPPPPPGQAKADVDQSNAEPLIRAGGLRLSATRPALTEPGLTYPEKVPVIAEHDEGALVLDGALGVAAPGKLALKAESRPSTVVSEKTSTVNTQPAAAETTPEVAPSTSQTIVPMDEIKRTAPTSAAKKTTVTTEKPVVKAPPAEQEKPVEPEEKAVEKQKPSTKMTAAAPTVADTVADSPSAVSSNNLFASLPDDAWVLQVATLADSAAADKQCGELSLPCTSYPAQRYGKVVRILVAGPFASRDDAVAKVAELPKAIRDKGPFPRQVQSLREDIANP